MLTFIIFALAIDLLTFMDRRLTLLIVALTCLMSACGGDERDMAVFSGIEPIYDLKVCDNRVTSLTLFLSHPDTVVLGIDGGDGDYRIVNAADSVIEAAFVDSLNGYRRIAISPRQVGKVDLQIVDGDGCRAQVKVNVRLRREYKMVKLEDEYGISAGYSQLLIELKDYLEAGIMLERGGYFLLIPDAKDVMGEGALEVYYTADDDEPIKGEYRTTATEGTENGYVWQFELEDGTQRIYLTSMGGPTGDVVVLTEDARVYCPDELLAEGVAVVHRALFTLMADED